MSAERSMPIIPQFAEAMCEKCGTLAEQRIETVEGHGPGFKCKCGWWNWLRDREWSR